MSAAQPAASPAAVEAPRLIGALLAFVAGVVDACTFLALFGLFVAQVTGSFVLAGAQIVSDDPLISIRVFAIPVFFFAGFATVFLAALAGESRRALAWALTAEFVLVAAFVAVGLCGAPFLQRRSALALIAGTLGVSAMGVQSALVRLLIRGFPSTNVMTTNTTLAAVETAQWWLAIRRAARQPQDRQAAEDAGEARRKFAMLWPVLLGFVAGTATGSVAFRYVGFWAPLMAVAVLAGLVIWAMRAARRG